MEVKAIHDKYRLTGENFNIFNILNIETSEIRHSAFLAELLNAQGSHGQGSKYLDLFLEQVGVVDFDLKTSETFVEHYIGEIDYKNKEGGYIDILIQDNEKSCIAIENKINARDQRYQLKRYHNFIMKQNDKSKLFYLNLFGDKPSKDSAGDLIEDSGYHIITYQSHILRWLEQCLEISENLPIIKDTIRQYIDVIIKLTNKMELVKLITKSSENMEIAYRVVECFDDAKQKILHNFWQTFCSTLADNVKSVRQGKNDDLIEKYYKSVKKDELIHLFVDIPDIHINDYQLCWGAEIEWNFYTGFCLCNKEGKPVKDKNGVNEIVTLLKDQKYETDDLENSYWLGWKYSHLHSDNTPGLNFKRLPVIFALANKDYLKNVVDKIVDDALEDIDAVKQSWNKQIRKLK